VARAAIVNSSAGAAGRQGPEVAEDQKLSAVCRRIVVADDNRDAVDSLALMLEIMGHEVCTVNDGQEAVEVVETFRPDVALLDIGMPGLNGYEAARLIRQQPWSRGMVLIAVTGWAQDEDRRRSHEAGFDKHMVKPVDPQALMNLLGEMDGVRSS
jgi:CheY-like chemotaxis protein